MHWNNSEGTSEGNVVNWYGAHCMMHISMKSIVWTSILDPDACVYEGRMYYTHIHDLGPWCRYDSQMYDAHIHDLGPWCICFVWCTNVWCTYYNNIIFCQTHFVVNSVMIQKSVAAGVEILIKSQLQHCSAEHISSLKHYHLSGSCGSTHTVWCLSGLTGKLWMLISAFLSNAWITFGPLSLSGQK